MKAAIIGLGRMGQAIAYAMDKLGFELGAADTNPVVSGLLPSKENNFYLLEEAGATEEAVLDIKPDVVISSLPFHQTEGLGRWCIDNGIRYCDLGGRVGVSRSINEYANEVATKPVMTDLGLAPGLVNILAEQGCRKIQGTPTEVHMMVGGLPLMPNNYPLNYFLTWSTDGLINEYKDNCEIIENGEIREVAGLEGWQNISTPNPNAPEDCAECQRSMQMEAFYTSGGASHTIKSMHARGVKNCTYRTIRYPGHHAVVRFLIRDCDLDNKALKDIFEKTCPISHSDVVLLKVHVSNDELAWAKDVVIRGSTNPTFSAMQRATAFSTAAAAALMAEGQMEGDKEQHRDYWTQFPLALTYADIPYDNFREKLNILGLEE